MKMREECNAIYYYKKEKALKYFYNYYCVDLKNLRRVHLKNT